MTGLIRRLERVKRQACATSGTAVPALLPPQPDEWNALIAHMAEDFREQVECYKVKLGLPAEKAFEEANTPHAYAANDARKRAAENLSWFELRSLFVRDPDAALEKWLQVMEAARDNLRCGEDAWKPVAPFFFSPWDMAKFLALRQELMSAWQPRNGMEQMLIDQVVQVHALIEMWQEELRTRRTLSNVGSRREPGEVPRVDDVQAIEQAMRAIGRLYDIKLQTLNTLQRMRRSAKGIIVRKASQINVAEQQINITAGP
jgi:hypothetical protein